MKNKITIIITFLLICMNVFFMSMTVYATEEDEIETSVESTNADELNEVDGSTVFYDLDETNVQSEPTESVIPVGAFTPDGQATVIDRIYETDGKEFYTFSTPAGNVFYLIIDHIRTDGNVYFLNAVTESDLIALAEQAGESVSESVIPTTEKSTTTDNESPENEQSTEKSDSKQEKNGNIGLVIFLVIAALAAGGVGYYVKIVRPKQQATTDDDDDETEVEPDDKDYESEEYDREYGETDDDDDSDYEDEETEDEE